MKQTIELKAIRQALSQMEDSIIFSLFRRSQYATNDRIYVPGGVHIDGFHGSFLDYLLRGRERLDATAGRYLDPREIPFTEVHPSLKVERLTEESGLAEVRINKNVEIKAIYIDSVNNLARPGDDNEYGYCAVIDITALQEISSRVHLGRYVAESKWQFDKDGILPHIVAEDWPALEEALRDRSVETQVYERVKEKGQRYGLNPEFIGQFYLEKVIPLTIDVEVEYLKKRITAATLPST